MFVLNRDLARELGQALLEAVECLETREEAEATSIQKWFGSKYVVVFGFDQSDETHFVVVR